MGPISHSHSLVTLCRTILQCPKPHLQSRVTDIPWVPGPALGNVGAPSPGPALEELSSFRWRWSCDNSGGQRRNTAPGYIWYCRKHGRTWRPWDGCLELIELTGKVGRELQAVRKNTERAMLWGWAGWAQGRQFTSFSLSRAEGTGQRGSAAAGSRIGKGTSWGLLDAEPQISNCIPRAAELKWGKENWEVRERGIKMKLSRKLGEKVRQKETKQQRSGTILLSLETHPDSLPPSHPPPRIPCHTHA